MYFLRPSRPWPTWKGAFPRTQFLATIPEDDIPPSMTTSYLEVDFGGPPFSRLNELKNWLRGFITTPDFFKQDPKHSLDDLHSALHAAIKEIWTKLDSELEATIHAAVDTQHSIECVEDAFWADRVLDVHKLHSTGLIGIKTLSRERVIALLLIARDEVQWLSNEIRRLEVYCKIAQELKGCKNRESFVYYPSARKDLPEELESLEGAGIMVRADGERVDVDDILEDGEIKDEDMIEAEEEAVRRDSKDIGARVNVKKQNLDYMEF